MAQPAQGGSNLSYLTVGNYLKSIGLENMTEVRSGTAGANNTPCSCLNCSPVCTSSYVQSPPSAWYSCFQVTRVLDIAMNPNSLFTPKDRRTGLNAHVCRCWCLKHAAMLVDASITQTQAIAHACP